MFKRLAGLMVVCWVAMGMILRHPVSSGWLRLGWVLCGSSALLLLLALVWRKRVWRWSLVGSGALVLWVGLLLPQRAIEPTKLRKGYLERLVHYRGTPYFWGGEGRQGIDCSGLPRRALRDALAEEVFRRGNGTALRALLEMWWFDSSAKALSEGYRGWTRSTGVHGTVSTLTDEKLEPGDLAVTEGGVHVMVYLGEGQWIQAEPDRAKVVVSDGKSDPTAWFDLPVGVHRWSLLDGGG
ncbi:hypothetical protein HNR46_002320 [Haloferula luteola]|uniref:NlpC/P60 domain-containing protein n=1 Tax=Haloferula luteola TaxID=595692 RepID=A0A840VE22_9BACT|nr:NlpC/P60 family protein [Haloferula luteola]MBB5352079.1 hypothetical protein [Haloferula luteola]